MYRIYVLKSLYCFQVNGEAERERDLSASVYPVRTILGKMNSKNLALEVITGCVVKYIKFIFSFQNP